MSIDSFFIVLLDQFGVVFFTSFMFLVQFEYNLLPFYRCY